MLTTLFHHFFFFPFKLTIFLMLDKYIFAKVNFPNNNKKVYCTIMLAAHNLIEIIKGTVNPKIIIFWHTTMFFQALLRHTQNETLGRMPICFQITNVEG